MSTCKTLLRICPTQPRPSLLPLSQCRHESSTRRHRKLLALPEAPSYTAIRSAPTLVFNPPSSAPSVYHTPLKFLPKEDKRRQLHAAAQIYATTAAHRRQSSPVAAPGTPLSSPSSLPPRPTSALPTPLREPYEKKYHLTDAEVEEIRSLRQSDPKVWTRVRLAEKFGCSQFFVGMVAKAPERAAAVAQTHEAARQKWGDRRKIAREDRERRKALWGRDA
ncbi:hypothetical protein T440DRAFT_256368 [Plenodomus tracheiphilus IPT5]|uniref:Uncharacterized protein n=1 Tax=Plenodomus tracheiphilus IPT5 TaxID=1408161 RepID=A0A6A7AU59_9PLEO|nr:hypothetical protein T440DRAFT_256368 [Plenodomus tracheiphilus IPT5]